MAEQTLREIALEKAQKRPELVDYLTKRAPILDCLKWIPASHGLWNVEEVLNGLEGAGFVDLDASLPTMKATTKLQTTYVSAMGGVMEVGEDKAAQFGGAAQYFARREEAVLRQAGMDTEKALFTDWWRKAALKSQGTFTKCGGAGNALSTIVVCRFDRENNIGIYDPTGFNSGRLLEVTPINGGNKYFLKSKVGVLGYGVEYKGRFGWQIVNPKYAVHALVNIDGDHLPTVTQIEDAIASVEGSAADTVIFGYHPVLQKSFNALKQSYIRYGNNDSSIRTTVGDINGIPIVGSYNVSKKDESAVA